MNPRIILTSGLGLTALVAALLAPQLLPRSARAAIGTEVAPAPVEAVVVEAEPPAIVPEPISEPVRRDIDLVIVLDTSGSMNGLLDSARSKLWDIVNEVGRLEPDAHLRVGLVSFGSPGVASAAGGFVVQQTDLTDDLDTVYAKAMALTTNGGDEYVGWALHDTVQKMSWSHQDNAAKIVFVAGNEGADQASQVHDFRTVGADARERGILINAMFAGGHEAGILARWAAVAEAGGGAYTNIDMDRGTVQVAAPQDRRLRELNDSLNATYVPYGARGEVGRANQVAQDANAYRLGVGSGSSRAVSKSNGVYANPSWDLVDAQAAGTVEVGKLDAADLPAALRTLSEAERTKWVQEKKAERDAVQKEILELSTARKAFIDAKRTHEGDAALDEAVGDFLEAHL